MNVVLIILILGVVLLIGYFSYLLGDIIYRIEQLEEYVYVDLTCVFLSGSKVIKNDSAT